MASATDPFPVVESQYETMRTEDTEGAMPTTPTVLSSAIISPSTAVP